MHVNRWPATRQRPRTWYVPVERELFEAIRSDQVHGFVCGARAGRRSYLNMERGDILGFYDGATAMLGSDIEVLFRRAKDLTTAGSLELAIDRTPLPDGELIPSGRVQRGFSAVDFYRRMPYCRGPATAMEFDPEYKDRRVA